MSRFPAPVIRRSLAGAGSLAACAALAVVGAPTAGAAAAPATVRIAHLSPDMAGADVYLTSFTGRTSVFLDDAKYGQVSPYRQLPSGAYTFAIRMHGAASTTPPLRSWTVDAKSGDAYTAAVVGAGSKARGVVLDDNLTPPASGHANVRLIQASSHLGTANVMATDGPLIARNAAFGSSTGYASIKAGSWPLRATGSGTTTAADVSVPAGSVTSLILLDTASGGERLTSVVDAAGAAQHSAPRGSVDAGGGGTAATVVDQPHSDAARDASFAGSALLALIGLALGTRRRVTRLRRR